MRTRFPNEDAVYTIEARRLRRLEEIAVLLNQPGKLTFDQRRDAANMIDLVLSEATMPSHIETTKAGIIDWKMEVERLNRLLAAALRDGKFFPE